MNKSNVVRPEMTVGTLIPFLILTFSLTWGLAAVLIFVGFSIPVFLLAVWSPGIVGIFLVWRHYGRKGLVSFFKRLTLWRAPLRWWLFLILGVPAVVYAGAAIKGTISDPFPFSPWVQVFPALVQAFFLLGTNEEFGWRGLALPLLQRRFSPFWAGLIIGIICATWHIPAFFIGGISFSDWSFLPYFVGVVAIYVILTPFFNASRGSLLVAYLFHFQMMNPIFPDAQPWDNILWIAVAVIVVWVNRSTMFKKGSGVTEVLMPEDNAVLES